MDSNPIVGIIRRAVPDDIDAIAEIERQSFSEPWSEQTLLSYLEQGCDIFVVTLDGTVCGFSVLDRSLITEAELYNIAVAPEHRGKGLSRLLMDAMIDVARKNSITRIMLEVRASNQTAIALYTAYGFEKVGIRAGYYRHPTENAILMDLMLNQKQAELGEKKETE